jgi:hypothetical protein
VNPRLDADWEGDGKPATFVFGGGVNFRTGSTLGDRLADDPSTALGARYIDLATTPGASLATTATETSLAAPAVAQQLSHDD